MSKKSTITIILLIVLIPAIVVSGALIFHEKYYAWISLSVALISCLPLFYCFERKNTNSSELTVLAVLVSISALSRVIFAFVPGFKPITAITVIVGMWLGKEAGFVVGSISAIISNFYFGQGPWTPFQMFSWGMIGLIAGILSKPLAGNKFLAYIYGALSGILFSMTMDVWTTLWVDGYFNISRYTASLLLGLPTMVEYAVSNVLFMIALSKPFGDKLSRIKKKYGLFIKNK